MKYVFRKDPFHARGTREKEMSDDLMFSKHEETTFDICEFCRYNPPSSFGGKPCTVCPASGREIETNADRIKAMRDEEFAMWLCSLIPWPECVQMCPGIDLCKEGEIGLLDWARENWMN